MTITSEQLAALADGELDEMTAARVRRAVEADPALASELEQLIQLRSMLSGRFDPVLTQPVPDRLSKLIEDAAKVVDLGEVRAARQKLWQRQEFRFGGGLAGWRSPHRSRSQCSWSGAMPSRLNMPEPNLRWHLTIPCRGRLRPMAPKCWSASATAAAGLAEALLAARAAGLPAAMIAAGNSR